MYRPSQGAGFSREGCIIVVERSDDGWCRGFAAGKQGWFPASYVEILPLEKLLKVEDTIDSHCVSNQIEVFTLT